MSEDAQSNHQTSLPAKQPKLFRPESRVSPEVIKARQAEQARRLRRWRMLWLRRLSGAYFLTAFFILVLVS